jgi:hypothetical protein
MSTIPPVVLGEVASDCQHGYPVTEPDRLAVFKKYTERMDEPYLEVKTKYQIVGAFLGDHEREWKSASMDMLEQFWSEPEHARFIYAEMVRSCYAFATIGVQDGTMSVTRRFSMLGAFLTAWIKLGKDTFLEELRDMKAESPNIKTMLDFQASIRKMGTNRGLVIFLANQIPCSCLDNDKKIAKQAPKTGRCNYCHSPDLKVELKKCSQCKISQYCSKDCQVADWKRGHKKDCKVFNYCREQTAAGKAQMRL